MRLARKAKSETEESPWNALLVSVVKSLLELGDVVVEQLEVVGDFLFAADRGIRTTTCPPVSRAMLFGVLRSKYGSTMMI